MRKFLVTFILVVVINSVYPITSANAADFSTSYEVTYLVDTNGSVTVDQNIKLTNLTAQFYSNQYIQSVGSIKIDNLKATDKSGTIPSKIVKTASSSAIQLNFSNQLVGKNSTRTFKIEYTTDSLTQKQGKTWNITLPRINSDTLSTYISHVSIPDSFGAATTIYPKEKNMQREPEKKQTTYSFDTSQITTSGITLNFGETQIYNLGLVYHLKNPKSESVYTEIALPMNTAYQTIQVDSLSPQPESVRADIDGNYIGRYKLKPNQNMEVIFSGKAAVYTKDLNPTPVLTDSDKKLYTSKQKYWETDDPQIASLAATLKTPQNIYRYVVSTLKYDTTKLTSQDFKRSGASFALTHPNKSVCMEFTDLFIALARAAGIPAREVNGFAYTDDTATRPISLSQDILHAWPEYWDDTRGWIQVDPTWESTTGGVDYFNVFDLNHVAFVQKGVNSESPYPAGSYKTTDTHSRDVLVSFSDDDLKLNEDFTIKITEPESIMAGIKRAGDIHIINKGNTAITDNLIINSSFKNAQTRTGNFIIIPPFGSYKQKLPESKTNFADDTTIETTVSLKDKRAIKSTVVIPFYKFPITYVAILYLVGIPILAHTGYNLLHKQYGKKTVSKKQ
jgi:transglutaminase-like putative cysteine protease